MVLKPSTSRLLIAYRWPMTLLLLAGLICASVMVGLWWLARGVQRGVEQSAGVPAVVLNELGELVDQATHVSMTQSFVSSLPMISDAGSGRLELASVERQDRSHEAYQKKSQRVALDIECKNAQRHDANLADDVEDETVEERTASWELD